MAWCPHSLPAAPAALHMWRRRACRLLQPVCRPRQPPLCAPYVAPPPCPSSACCSTRGAPGQCVPPHAQRCRHTRRRRPCRPLAAALRARFPAGRLAAQFSAPVPPPPPPPPHTHTLTLHTPSRHAAAAWLHRQAPPALPPSLCFSGSPTLLPLARPWACPRGTRTRPAVAAACPCGAGAPPLSLMTPVAPSHTALTEPSLTRPPRRCNPPGVSRRSRPDRRCSRWSRDALRLHEVCARCSSQREGAR